METTVEKTTPNEFKAWLGTIPVSDYTVVKRRIIELCKTKDYIFRNWKCGVTKVPLLEKTIINEIALKYNGSICFKTTEP